MNANKKLVIVLIFVHLAIALPFAYLVNIWVDESSTLYTTERGFFFALQNAATDERQAPLYFWILSLWREIDKSIFFARLFSVICSCSAIKFFSDAAQKILGGKTAVYAAVFFSLHPFLIWASAEIRVYSLVILLSVLLIKFFYEGFFEADESRSKRNKILYAAIAVVSIYANYYLGFLLAGNFLALLFTGRFKQAKDYVLYMLCVGAAILPLAWAIKAQTAVNTSGFAAEKNLVEALKILWNHFLNFLLPAELFPTEESSVILTVRLWTGRLAVLTAAIFALKNYRKISEKNFAFGIITLTVFGFLLIAYFLLGPVYTGLRHAAVAFAATIFFAATVLQTIFENEAKPLKNYEKYLSVAAAIVIGIFFTYSISTLYPNLAKRGDWARVGAFIAQNEQPNQPVIVFNAFDAPAMKYHYNGVNKVFPQARFFEWEPEAEAGSAKRYGKQIEFIISEIPPKAREVWLLTNEICSVGQNCEPLENFVRANYTVVTEKDFYKEKVRLLRKN